MKIILLVALLVCIALSQVSTGKVGGFKPITQQKLSQLQGEQIFTSAITKARQEYLKTHGENLGDIKSVSEQIVSGINYKMVFNSKSGPVQVTVYCQAWTNTYEVTEMKPFVEEN